MWLSTWRIGWVSRCLPQGENDERDAADLADLLRMGRLPESWIAPPHVRGAAGAGAPPRQAGLATHRAQCSVHAVLAKCGISVPMSDLFGVAGERMLARLPLAAAYQARIASLHGLINACDKETDVVAKAVGYRVAQIPGCKAIQAIDAEHETIQSISGTVNTVRRLGGPPRGALPKRTRSGQSAPRAGCGTDRPDPAWLLPAAATRVNAPSWALGRQAGHPTTPRPATHR